MNGHDDGVGPGRREHERIDRVGDDRAAGHGDLRDAGALDVPADRHGLSGPGRADDGDDLVLLDQLAGRRDGLGLVGGVVLEITSIGGR